MTTSVARDVSNLQGVLQGLGDLAGARAAYERALAILEAFGNRCLDVVRRKLASLDD